MGLYHPLNGVTNLKYKLFFLTPNKKNSKREALAFHRVGCCHLAICLWLILFHLTTWSLPDIVPEQLQIIPVLDTACPERLPETQDALETLCLAANVAILES
jgi:hypothetical protein